MTEALKKHGCAKWGHRHLSGIKWRLIYCLDSRFYDRTKRKGGKRCNIEDNQWWRAELKWLSDSLRHLKSKRGCGWVVGGGVGHLPRSPPAVTVELFKNKKGRKLYPMQHCSQFQCCCMLWKLPVTADLLARACQRTGISHLNKQDLAEKTRLNVACLLFCFGFCF